MHCRCPAGGLEQKALAILGNPGRVDIGMQRLGEGMVTRHHVMFSAFFMKPDRPAGAARRQVLDPHLQGGIDPREAVPPSKAGHHLASVDPFKSKQIGRHLVCIALPVDPETNRSDNTIFSDPGALCTHGREKSG